jgi:anionic cell wall polymer biosynthesis LytR-Cps2A-Psr (LCP) family protein
MYKSSSSRVLPIIIVIIVVAVAIAVLVSVGRAIFGGTSTPSTSKVDVGVESLLNTAVDRSVRMTVRGPLVADENFRSYQVAVDSSSRRLTTYSGYLDQTLQSVQLNNNTKAYEEFVYALNRANLMKGTELEGAKNDTRGICATGRVYEFEVLQGNSVVKRLWTSTCKGSQGSLKASVSQLQKLFLEQIPNNKTTLKNIDL